MIILQHSIAYCLFMDVYGIFMGHIYNRFHVSNLLFCNIEVHKPQVKDPVSFLDVTQDKMIEPTLFKRPLSRSNRRICLARTFVVAHNPEVQEIVGFVTKSGRNEEADGTALGVA